MKAIYNYILVAVMAGLLVFGCGNIADSEKKDDSVPNKLSQSQGNNELNGKSFQSSSCSLTFSGDSVTYKADGASSGSLRSATSSLRSASTWTDLLKYKYSWNSESNPKTLDFQLSQVWGTGVAQDYEEQLAAAKKKVSATAQAVNEALANDNLYPAALGSVKEKVKGQVTTKGKAYTDSQQQLLETYLKAKYESVIKFNYELTADKLTLTEQFKKDLTDASSKLTGTSGSATFTLNDYSNLIPFKVEVGGKTYVGVPEIKPNNADSGSLSVQLYPYYGDMTDTTVATKIAAAVTTKLTEGATSSGVAIAAELGNGSSSSTLDGLLDEAIGGSKLEATYTLSDNGATFSFTTKPSFLSSVGNSVTMTHQPLLGGTFNLVQ